MAYEEREPEAKFWRFGREVPGPVFSLLPGMVTLNVKTRLISILRWELGVRYDGRSELPAEMVHPRHENWGMEKN